MKTLTNIMQELFTRGHVVSPRGQRVLEIMNYQFEVYADEFGLNNRFFNFGHRNLKLNYIKQEFLWYLGGSLYDDSIEQHARMWALIKDDDGKYNSNYGHYIFKMGQFDNVVRWLSQDKDTRRANISILDRDHLVSDSKDIPCTMGINFNIRDDKLNMTVMMRSNDAWFGFANDIPAFAFIHEMMLVTLSDKVYPTLQLGSYTHFANSFHLYERHWSSMKDVLDNPDDYTFIDCPRIHDVKEVEQLIARDFNNDNQFTRWLLDNE